MTGKKKQQLDKMINKKESFLDIKNALASQPFLWQSDSVLGPEFESAGCSLTQLETLKRTTDW